MKLVLVIFLCLLPSLSSAGENDLIIEKIAQEQGHSVKAISQTFYWLKRQGVIKIERVITEFPQIIIYKQKFLDSRIFWLKALGIRKIGRVIEGYPQVLLSETNEKFKPFVEWLQKNGASNVAKVIEVEPELLGYSVAEDLQLKLDLFRSLGVRNLPYLVQNVSEIFAPSLVNLKAMIAWMKSEGVENVGLVVERAPRLFTLRLEENLIPKAKWFESKGVNDIARILKSSPRIFHYSIENNLEPKFRWFQEIGVQDVGKLIQRKPSILSLNLENNLKPTFMELTKNWGITLQQIENNPALLEVSLDRTNRLSMGLFRGGTIPSSLTLQTRLYLLRSVSLEGLPDLSAEYLNGCVRKMAKLARLARVSR